jgi:benzoyl-CoA reductase/2-hydroxyglutaryl-CoA dehydratase subunit BcrC/BadD/HgdB
VRVLTVGGECQDLAYWVSELERLAEGMAGIRGVSVTRTRLRDAILRRRAQHDAFHYLDGARSALPQVLAGSNMALAAAASAASDPVQWSQAARQLAAEVRKLGSAREGLRGSVPLVLTGAPVLWPSFKLYHVVERAGGMIVGDTLCSLTQALQDSG